MSSEAAAGYQASQGSEGVQCALCHQSFPILPCLQAHLLDSWKHRQTCSLLYSLMISRCPSPPLGSMQPYLQSSVQVDRQEQEPGTSSGLNPVLAELGARQCRRIDPLQADVNSDDPSQVSNEAPGYQGSQGWEVDQADLNKLPPYRCPPFGVKLPENREPSPEAKFWLKEMISRRHKDDRHELCAKRFHPGLSSTSSTSASSSSPRSHERLRSSISPTSSLVSSSTTSDRPRKRKRGHDVSLSEPLMSPGHQPSQSTLSLGEESHQAGPSWMTTVNGQQSFVPLSYRPQLRGGSGSVVHLGKLMGTYVWSMLG
ncbi:hypothetical protein DPEC_G00097030 [Dallia pectoralis]|uniref:Uncharacterized protein n=1 Tax=Dallia pectoralis TaxID=75939 RepID=A0ACC2GVH8_DALPE|nr:hypothetical protein DPEC_G00097030 [Dallia pectoralis]